MRVRFAPSPTGALHIGGARTALYNWLMARHAGGTLVLRIEDTDRERSTPENVAQIIDALQWLELDWDEGPISQISRAERHQEVLQQLLDDGHAYRTPATADDVRAYKDVHGAERGFRGEPAAEGAVRLRVPDEGETVVHDLIRGDIEFAHEHLDDPVIARADGSVLYNFAVAVDDLDAGITHVVRGEDHISNTPKQLLVLEALGAHEPLYAHLPLLHGPDGKKLSKRHGAASVQELRDGRLPARGGAQLPRAARLGRGRRSDDPVDRRAGRAVLDRARVAQPGALRRAEAALAQRPLRPRACRERRARRGAGAVHGPHGLDAAVAISSEKIQTLADFWPLSGFLFDGPVDDPAAHERWLDADGRGALAEAREALAGADPFELESVETALKAVVEARHAKPRDVYQPVRVALGGDHPHRPGSSSRWSSSDATRASGASTLR